MKEVARIYIRNLEVSKAHELLKLLKKQGVNADLDVEKPTLFDDEYDAVNRAWGKVSELDIPDYGDSETLREVVGDIKNIRKRVEAFQKALVKVVSVADRLEAAVVAKEVTK